MTPLLHGGDSLTQTLSAPPRPTAAGSLDRRPVSCNIAVPVYVRENLQAYMLAHEDSTFRTVVMQGLRSLGIAIDDEDMIPERAMRRSRKRDVQPDDTPGTLKPTSIRLPYYVRARAEEYLLDHPQMRFRHLAMAALKELGIEVNDEDLVAERQNVLAVARVRQDPCRD